MFGGDDEYGGGGDDEYGGDISIRNDCNLNQLSFSNFGMTYNLPNGITINSKESKSYLTGQHYF
jgi:hypothetical protein